MTIGIAHLQPIVALIAGILILVIPRLLNIIVAVYLIIIGCSASAFSVRTYLRACARLCGGAFKGPPSTNPA